MTTSNSTLRIASWNTNSIRTRQEHLITWLQDNQPDVMAIQETKVQDEQFPAQALEDIGYHAFFHGQKAYNGVAWLSKKPWQPSQLRAKHWPTWDDEQCRIMAIDIDDITLVNVYVPNGQSISSDKFEYKLNWLRQLYKLCRSWLEERTNIIITGDFNIAPLDVDTHNPKRWENSVLTAPQVRQALNAILDLGFCDGFRLFHPEGEAYSWWDYRGGAWEKQDGLRIDLMLISQNLVPRCLQCDIDRSTRALEKPSDHAILEMLIKLKNHEDVVA